MDGVGALRDARFTGPMSPSAVGVGARQASLELVIVSYFPLLQLTPAGANFTSAEDRGVDADPVLVVSHVFAA